MTTDAALIEKREELKRRLSAGEYRTLIDFLLDGTGRIIQKITRSSQPISPWYSSMVLYLIIQLSAFIILTFIGRLLILRGGSSEFFVSAILVSLSIGYLFVPSIVVSNFYIHHVFMTFHESVLDTVESSFTVDDFERWLISVCNRKIHLMMSIIGGVPIGIFLIGLYESETGLLFMLESLNEISIAITILLISIGNIMFLYLLLHMVILSERIGWYSLRLHTANPGSSEVIGRLANLLGKFVFLVGIYGAYFALITAWSDSQISQFFILWVPLLWIPIIAMFFLYQSSLSNIIKKAKWKTLNEIQFKIEELHESEKLGEKDDMETINRLMDYYDRIKSTRNSTFDSGAILNLINSLLLPLLALALANLDRILYLFR